MKLDLKDIFDEFGLEVTDKEIEETFTRLGFIKHIEEGEYNGKVAEKQRGYIKRYTEYY